MNFVAIDIETADSSNSAPCAIGFAVAEDGKIVEKIEYRINPEVRFNPMAIRIHGIKPEDVIDSPTLPQIWQPIIELLTKYPLVAHNATFDISVLRKSAKKYALPLPAISCYCTMMASQKWLQVDNTKLKTVCSFIGIPYDKQHVAENDAEACAGVMLYFCDKGLDVPTIQSCLIQNDADAFSALDDFEKECLRVVADIISRKNIPSELVRFQKKKTLDIDFYYRVIRIGTVRQRRFIGVRDKYMHSIKCDLDHDETKEFHRFFLNSPSDLNCFAEFIQATANDSHNDFNEYKKLVSQKTVEKHMKKYTSSTNGFMDFFATNN